jgi:hypothetical protein
VTLSPAIVGIGMDKNVNTIYVSAAKIPENTSLLKLSLLALSIAAVEFRLFIINLRLCLAFVYEKYIRI